MGDSATKEAVIHAVHEMAQELGYLVYDASVLLRGENTQIVVKIDHLKGISLRDCEEYSKALTRALDAARILPNYSLEVSSPGITRELRSIDDFTRFSGSNVKVIYDAGGMQKVEKGVIAGVREGCVVLDTGKGTVSFEYGAVKKANLDL
jgi:ribosome maturation factor RimP